MPSFRLSSRFRARLSSVSLFALGVFAGAPAVLAQDAPSPAAAQDAAAANAPAGADLPPVEVVGATRIATPESQLGTSVTVITADEIAAKQQRTLPDALQDVPGLNMVQTGGPGGLASVFIRGANSNQTKVLIDGMEVSDPSTPNGAFDFAPILTFDLDRIEVLRGPQSGLYGSDAMGGVINIITDKGEGPTRAVVSLEGGSFGTFNQTAKVSGSSGPISYFLGFAHFSSTETPVTPPNLVPPGRAINPSAYDNRTFSVRLGAQVTDWLDIGLTGRYIDSSLWSTSDDFLGPESMLSQSATTQSMTRAFAHSSLFDGRLDQTIAFSYVDYDRSYLDPNSNPASRSLYTGQRLKGEYTGSVKLIEGQTLVFGAERQSERLANTNPTFAVDGDTAGYVTLQSDFGGRLFNAASLRYDADDQFGGKATFRLAPAFLIPETGTKIKGSVGTGFKAPTLDQLYSNYPAFGFYGNPNLRPETSTGVDAGIEQTLLPNRVSVGATWFHNDFWNLIDFNDTFTSYANIGRATTQGLESFMALSPFDGLNFRADYTYTVATNDVTELYLLRRPKDKLSFQATWQATPALLLSATFTYVGAWRDVNRSGTEGYLLAPAYQLLNLAATYDFGHGASAFARIQNVFNRQYENPLGFLQPRLGVYGGVRLALGPEGFL